MCEDSKKRLQHAVARFKQGFADRPTRALDELLSSDVVSAIIEEEVGSYRERVYPPLTTLGLFIGQALSSDGSGEGARSSCSTAPPFPCPTPKPIKRCIQVASRHCSARSCRI